MAIGVNQTNVGCPFYSSDDGQQRITCCGLVPDSTIALWYRKREDFEIQLKTFCCEHYKKCEIYRMLMEMWDDE